MAQQFTISPDVLGACYVGEESTFGTAPVGMVRMLPVAGSVESAAMQAGIERSQLSPAAWDVLDTVDGLKEGSVTLAHYLQPAATVLSHSATVPTSADVPLATLMRCLLGGQSVAQGTQVATATSESAVTVTTGQGSRCPAGQIILVDDPADGILPARVLTRSGDDITFWPSLSATGEVGDEIINTYTWFPTAENARSLAVALAHASGAGLQWQWTGGTGDLELLFERNQLAQLKTQLKFALWQGPAALSYSAARVADPMSAPLAVRNCKLYLQPLATTTRSNYAVDTLKLTIKPGMQHLETLTGGTEGRRGVARVEGLNEAFAEMEFEVPFDTALDTYWAAKTKLCAMFIVQADVAGGGRRHIVVDARRTVIKDKPAIKRGKDNQLKYAVTLRTQLDTLTSDVAGLGTSPLCVAIG